MTRHDALTEPESTPDGGAEAGGEPVGLPPEEADAGEVNEAGEVTEQTTTTTTAPPPAMSQMLFVDISLVLPSTHPVVVLQEADWPYRELRIPVGGAEGVAIAYAARRVATPRPLTHEMVSRLLDAFDLTLDAVHITAVEGANFVAELQLSGRSGLRSVDCRPSDGIALALRRPIPVPIMVAPEVHERAGGAAASGN